MVSMNSFFIRVVDGGEFFEAGIAQRVMEKKILGTTNGRAPMVGENGM